MAGVASQRFEKPCGGMGSSERGYGQDLQNDGETPPSLKLTANAPENGGTPWNSGDSELGKQHFFRGELLVLWFRVYSLEVEQFAPENRPKCPKGKDRLPTIIFQRPC